MTIVVTINMPRLGYVSDSEEDFLIRLEKQMILAKQSLEIKRKVLEKFTEGNLYPYSKFYLRKVKKRFDRYWNNHFSTIGIVGMNEAALNLIDEGIDTAKGKAFAIKVLKFMRKTIQEFQEETGNLYNLEATPAESTSYRLARLDRQKYKNIKTSGTEKFPFLTNSTQLNVDATRDVFEALEHLSGAKGQFRFNSTKNLSKPLSCS